MGFRLRRRVSVLSGLIGMLLLFPPPRAHAAGSEADRMAQQVWDALLTKCGDSYFYSGSVFDRSGMIADLKMSKHQSVYEFKKVRFNLVPMRVSEAEQMNGIQYIGRMTMIAGVYRSDGGAWSDGPAMQARNTQDIMAGALKDFLGDQMDMGMGGAIALELKEYKGRWAVSRSSVDQSGMLLSSKGYYEVEKVVGAYGGRHSCGGMPGGTAGGTTGGTSGGMMPGGAAQPVAAGMPDSQARIVRAALSSTRASPLIQDARKGVAFLALTPQELAAFTFLHDGTRFGSPQAAPYKQVTQAAGDRFPTGGNLPDSQYLRPGTAYRPIYYDDRDPRHALAQMQNVRTGDQRYLVLVAVTSGPHAGETVLIDARAMNADRPIVQASAAR